MPLTQCMQQTTNRQYNLWTMYLDDQWNKPSRTDNYLMVIAAEVRAVLAKNRNTIKLKHFLLKFQTGTSPKVNKKAANAIAKSSWIGAVGKNITKIIKPKSDGK